MMLYMSLAVIITMKAENMMACCWEVQ